MPTISMFYGILVAMYVLDTDKHHHPHIHIRYNEFKAVLKIPRGEVMDMTPNVIKVLAMPDYSIEAEFETGEVRRFDMRPYLDFPAFAPLKEPGLFMRAHIAHRTVVWTEEIDLSPDTLYLRGQVG